MPNVPAKPSNLWDRQLGTAPGTPSLGLREGNQPPGPPGFLAATPRWTSCRCSCELQVAMFRGSPVPLVPLGQESGQTKRQARADARIILKRKPPLHGPSPASHPPTQNVI